ncbi:hypothetical protein [Halochromatium sp.]
MNAGEIVQAWALACCQTLETQDIEGHMNLISKQIKVFGLADFDFVDYNFWQNQVQEQFANGLVTSLRYYLHSVRTDSENQISFTAIEYLTDKDGREHENPLLVVLSKEPDGVWRATEEKILTEDQARAAGLSRLH